MAAAGGKRVASLKRARTVELDAAIVVFGEHPVRRNTGRYRFSRLAAAQQARPAADRTAYGDGAYPVVSLFLTGRPLWVNAELNASDAFVVAWLPGSEGARGG